MANIPRNVAKEVTDKFSVKNNTFSRAVKDNPKDKIELEIGDSKQSDFKPQARIQRWSNEVNFSLRWKEPETLDTPVVETVGKEIRYKKGKQSFQAYELDPGDVGEDGGLEIEIKLDEKPDTNIFEFTLQTKGLNFFYQPALTQEEIDQGANRPDDVVGSYAAYHKYKGGMNRADGMEYKTGKAFHIYRPFAHDTNGDGVYADLHIDEENNLLTVTVSQDFLDNAVYPVVVDPTFGYTSVGASTGDIATNSGSICLSADTMLVTESGLKKIELVKVGDKVLTVNVAGEEEFDVVRDVFNRDISYYGNKFYRIYTGKKYIDTTYNHSFMIDNKVTKAVDLKVGDMVLFDKKRRKISSIKIVDVENVKVWDISLDKNHNFIANNFLVCDATYK